VAVLPSHAPFTWHVTTAAYSYLRGVYMRQGTKVTEELSRVPPYHFMYVVQVHILDDAQEGGRGWL
jgi:hypothetical protein